MQVIHPCCAGVDVHKASLHVCVVRTQGNGRTKQETRQFSTMTADLLEMSDWLVGWGCTHVAMESTGEYWKPVYNILESTFTLLVVNARHMKAVPGRKTDVNDAQWIADLLRHGLVRGSFVPERDQRDLRDLTRQRSNLVRERVRVVNRLQKALESANIKLACVATDIMGVSGRNMLEAIIEGEADPSTLTELARGKLRKKATELEKALEGTTRNHHRFVLARHILHLDFLDEQIDAYNTQVTGQIARMSQPAPPNEASACRASSPAATDSAKGMDRSGNGLTFEEAIALLDPIPGIDRRLAEIILAETGTDMTRFPTHAHLCAWAGVAPGNNESAGKRYSGKSRPGNPALRTALVQAAHGARNTKSSYLRTQWYRISARRGKKRAIVAVAHSILTDIYHILLVGKPYRDLGSDYFDNVDRVGITKRLTKRLEQMGYRVSLEVSQAGAAG